MNLVISFSFGFLVSFFCIREQKKIEGAIFSFFWRKR
uniref:Uncharacterized protein n=1 Tax=Nelumbo nucifera TaxID=4432 RepID=A0A822ZCQ1_NELNU|nr:TPA_asm: hypothetical protein HUJ06_001142 [Nelumbo nucifera]